MQYIKKYWIELLTIGLVFVILLICQAPDMTWMNTDSDGIHYTYSAQWLYPAHKQSAPLYLLLGNLFMRLPFGTEFWRMALISVISGAIGSALIIGIIKEHLKEIKFSKYYAVIGSLIYGGSALAISQNTIVEAYPLVVTICLACYYFAIKSKWILSCVMAGIAIAIHPTSLIVIIPIIIGFKELRNWRRLIIIIPFFLFYLYVPITNRPPYMWQLPKGEGNNLGFVNDAVSTITMLVGGLAIYDLPKRILDTIGLVLLNFAIIGIVPFVYAFKNVKKIFKNTLFWLVAIPTIYYVISLAPQVYVYMQFAIAFGAVVIGIGLSKVNKKIFYATGVATIVLLAINTNYFDIGRTLDKNLSAVQYYDVELDKVQDGQILMPYYGWEWAAIYRYNKENNRNIIPVCIDTLVSIDYQNMLIEYGVKFDDNNDEDRVQRQNYIALSIIELNDNVWTTRTTEAETYGCEVLPATTELLIKTPTEPAGQWHWKPNNPYDIITGACEIKSWSFITMSNHNVLYVSLVIGVVYLLFVMIERRTKKHE